MFADRGQSSNASLALVDVADFDKKGLVDAEVTSESNITILISNDKAGFTEAKGTPLFGGFLPNNISLLCHYRCSNKFDCIIVL